METIKKITELTGFNEKDLLGKSRKSTLTIIRQLHWEKMNESGYTLTEIAKIYDRDPSTIFYGINHINDLLSIGDKEVSKIWENIRRIHIDIPKVTNEFEEIMIIGFKERFIQPIIDGKKKHTIRDDKTNRWCTGKKMNMAIGVRTKHYKQFIEKTCTGTQHIKITYLFVQNRAIVHIDNCFFGEVFFAENKVLTFTGDLEILAKNDGFENVNEFFEWFHSDFTGKIIHWTDFRY